MYGHETNDSGTDISTPFSILIEYEPTEYSYSIQYLIRIPNVEVIDSIFDSNETPDLSHP